MKSVFLSLIIFMLAAGIVIAENKEKLSKPVEGIKKGRVSKLSGGKFSRIYMYLIHKTKTLDLTEAQNTQIRNIARPLVRPILLEEKKSSKFQKQFMVQLDSKQFDPQKLNTIAIDIQEANIEAADNFIIAVTSLIEIIGPQNYAKLRPISRIDRNALVQLREGNAEKLMEVSDKDPEPKAEYNK